MFISDKWQMLVLDFPIKQPLESQLKGVAELLNKFESNSISNLLKPSALQLLKSEINCFNQISLGQVQAENQIYFLLPKLPTCHTNNRVFKYNFKPKCSKIVGITEIVRSNRNVNGNGANWTLKRQLKCKRHTKTT